MIITKEVMRDQLLAYLNHDARVTTRIADNQFRGKVLGQLLVRDPFIS